MRLPGRPPRPRAATETASPGPRASRAVCSRARARGSPRCRRRSPRPPAATATPCGSLRFTAPPGAPGARTRAHRGDEVAVRVEVANHVVVAIAHPHRPVGCEREPRGTEEAAAEGDAAAAAPRRPVGDVGAVGERRARAGYSGTISRNASATSRRPPGPAATSTGATNWPGAMPELPPRRAAARLRACTRRCGRRSSPRRTRCPPCEVATARRKCVSR